MNLSVKKLTALTSESAQRLNETMLRPLWKVLTFSPADDVVAPQKNISIAIEKGKLIIAYGSRFLSRYSIKGFKTYSFEGRYPQPDILASSSVLAMNDFGATKATVSLSIPKAWVIIKTAELPITVKENLSDVISYEMDRLTPFSSDDSFFDFKILSETEEKLNVLIMAIKADVVKPYIDALRDNGIIVSRLSVNLSSIGTLCRYINNEADFVFIEINDSGYEGASFLSGSIHDVLSGNFDTDDENSKVNTVVSEINLFLANLKKQNKIPKIMVLLKDKSPTLKELFKVHVNLPIEILNDKDIKIKLPRHTDYIPYAAIGEVLESLWTKTNGLNLLKKGHYEKTKFPKTLTIILILSIVAIWILYMIAPLRIEGKRLNEIDRQLTLRKEDVKKVESLRKEVDTLKNEISTIDNFKEDRPMTLNILKELTTILPKNTWLTRMNIRESIVNIEGYSSSATTLLPKLEASKYFKKAEFASPTFRDARMNADRFNIKMEIEGFKKQEEGKPAVEKK
jgi:Tfp pilus assembly protein PilN